MCSRLCVALLAHQRLLSLLSFVVCCAARCLPRLHGANSKPSAVNPLQQQLELVIKAERHSYRRRGRCASPSCSAVLCCQLRTQTFAIGGVGAFALQQLQFHLDSILFCAALSTMPKGAGRPSIKGAGKARQAPRKKLSAQELYLQAQVALQFDDCESALESLKQAVTLEPRNLEVGGAAAARDCTPPAPCKSLADVCCRSAMARLHRLMHGMQPATSNP